MIIDAPCALGEVHQQGIELDDLDVRGRCRDLAAHHRQPLVDA